MAKKDLQTIEVTNIIATDDEIRMLWNLRSQVKRWPHGKFGPVYFVTHDGEVKHGIFKETENIETRI